MNGSLENHVMGPKFFSEHNDVLQGESDKSQPSDSLTEDGKARKDFWAIAGNCIYRHLLETRGKLDVRSSRKPCKMLATTLESSMDSAAPCKVQKLGHGESAGKNESNTRRSKYACVVEAHESARTGLENSTKLYEDRIAGKGINSLIHYNLAHKFFPTLQAMKIPDAKDGVDKELEKLEN